MTMENFISGGREFQQAGMVVTDMMEKAEERSRVERKRRRTRTRTMVRNGGEEEERLIKRRGQRRKLSEHRSGRENVVRSVSGITDPRASRFLPPASTSASPACLAPPAYAPLRCSLLSSQRYLSPNIPSSSVSYLVPMFSFSRIPNPMTILSIRHTHRR